MFHVYPHLRVDTIDNFAKYKGEILQSGEIGSVDFPSYNTGALTVNREMNILTLTNVPVLGEAGFIDFTDVFEGFTILKIFLETKTGELKTIMTDITSTVAKIHHLRIFTVKFGEEDELHIRADPQTGVFEIHSSRKTSEGDKVIGLFMNIIRKNPNRRPV